jgi:Ca-activated chloride channel family protein
MLLSLPSLPAVKSLLPNTPAGASAGAELVTSDGRSLALVAARLVGEAQGGLARLVLEQQFANAYDETLKVTYRMPLPADGAISGYEFVIGERTIKGTIDKKHQARERFERALVEGRTAALLEQERADIFTQQIGNIPPHATIVARITVDQRLVWLPEGEWELRFPTVIGPRYIGSADTAADVRATHIKVSDEPLTARIQIELAIKDAIVAGATPSSPSHTLTKRDGGVVELTAGSRLDRDIVVRWPVAAAEPGLSLAAARTTSGNDAYALLTIVPPAREAKPVAVPRDLIILLDTSGSMSGGPLDKAKQVVAMLIDSLDEVDRLELIEFSNSPRRYLDVPVQATAHAKAAAIKWVRSRVADGGTEMRAGVIEALQTLRVAAQRQVVVVTDGYVGGEQQILEALNRRLPKSCRLHVLGVGAAVNRSLATSLARAGRGTEVIVGIDEDAERGAKRLLDRTRSPMLTNVEISGSALLRHAPALVPDVFAGSPLVCALALRPQGGEILVRGQLARDSYEQRITVKPVGAGEGNQAIVQLYGRERVADVEANAMFGSVDGEIEDLGLTFQIATRMTSWIAIDEVRREVGTTRDELVPQELPYGTSASAFGLRAVSVPMQAAANMMQSLAEASFDAAAMPAGAPMLGRARMAPPAPGAGRPRASAAAPLPPSSYQTRAGVLKGRAPIADDDFESEEPTGRTAPPEEMDEGEASDRMKSIGVRGPRPMESAPLPSASFDESRLSLDAKLEVPADEEPAAEKPAAPRRPSPTPARQLQAPKPVAPAPVAKPPAQPAAPTATPEPEPRAKTTATPEPELQTRTGLAKPAVHVQAELAPAAQQQLRKPSPLKWLALAALLVIIAVLVWWWLAR